jgi:hypothetical protein
MATSPEIKFGSVDGEACVWVPGEAWVLKDGSWARGNSSEIGMEGGVLSKEAFADRFGSDQGLPGRDLTTRWSFHLTGVTVSAVPLVELTQPDAVSLLGLRSL